MAFERLRLDNRAIAVTGAAGAGIGEATVKLLAARGAHVLVVDIDAEGAERVATEIRATGAVAESFACDVTDESQVAAMVEKTVAAYGRLDGAFNNAGGSLGLFAELHELELENFERVTNLNVRGTFLSLKHEIAQIRRQGSSGAIVNTASALALIGTTKLAHYVAAKHAVLGLTRAAALENGAAGIRVNAVLPGVTQTAALGRLHAGDAEVKRRSPTQNVLGHVGSPEDIAEAVAYLLSDAAANVTGAPITVDGGWTVG